MLRKPRPQIATEPIRDPFGLGTDTRTHEMKTDDQQVEPVNQGHSAVNPLWMITGGLVAFVLLLTAFW